VQRHVLYLGEINDGQRAAWCQTIEAIDESGQAGRQIALFPEDRAAPSLDCDVVHVRLSGLRLRRPRQWGGCWLACHLWDQLELDDFWSPRLPPSRHQGTRWLSILKTLVAYRLIDPGSEWRLHRHPGLLPASYPETAAAVAGTGTDAAVCPGQDVGDPNGRRSPADDGQPHRHSVALHRTRAGSGAAATDAEAQFARPTAAKDHVGRHSDIAMTAAPVVPTLQDPTTGNRPPGGLFDASCERRANRASGCRRAAASGTMSDTRSPDGSGQKM
jgi:hypothetical protein